MKPHGVNCKYLDTACDACYHEAMQGFAESCEPTPVKALKTASEMIDSIPHLKACIDHMGCRADAEIALQCFADQFIERCAEAGGTAIFGHVKEEILEVKREVK